LIIGIFITSCAQLLLKLGVMQTKLIVGPKIIWQILSNKFLFFGFALYGIGAIMWLFIIKKLPISVAYPSVSLSYVIVALLAYLFFKEALFPLKIFGLVLIISGIIMMSLKTN